MKRTLFDSLSESDDTRGKHGKQFKFKYFFMYLIMAELAGANSVRKKEIYLKENRRELGLLFDEHWHVAPTKSSINRFINSLDERILSKLLNIFNFDNKNKKEFHIDGKTICGSGTNILNVFTEKTRQCVSKTEFKKGQEIAAVYNILKLGKFKPNDWVTLDAIHAQKKQLN